MSAQTVGWVCDQATSKRRLRVAVIGPGCVELLVEMSGQPPAIVELDVEGAVFLVTLLAQALAIGPGEAC